MLRGVGGCTARGLQGAGGCAAQGDGGHDFPALPGRRDGSSGPWSLCRPHAMTQDPQPRYPASWWLRCPKRKGHPELSPSEHPVLCGGMS